VVAATFDLVYEAPASCPGRTVLAEQVAARVGYDPIDEASETAASVRIVEEAGEFRATIVVRGATPQDGRAGEGADRVFRRTLASKDCRELVGAVALPLAAYVDPILGSSPRAVVPARTHPAPTEAVEDPFQLPPDPEERARPERAEPSATGSRFAVSAAAAFALGLAPSASLGPRIGLSWETRRLRVGLEGRADLSLSTRSARGAELSASLVGGAFVPCMHTGTLFACGELALGRYEARAVANGASWADGTLFGALGVRVGASLAAGPLALEVYAFASSPLSRVDFVVGGDPVFRTAPIFGGVALGAALGRFLGER
jgi:hypothetical protein